jgi:hypothetical protein
VYTSLILGNSPKMPLSAVAGAGAGVADRAEGDAGFVVDCLVVDVDQAAGYAIRQGEALHDAEGQPVVGARGEPGRLVEVLEGGDGCD